jgi:hypothetical protein
VQLDLYTQIRLSVLSVYQSENKSICNNDTRWKLKISMTFFTSEKTDSRKALIFACICDENWLVVDITAFMPK